MTMFSVKTENFCWNYEELFLKLETLNMGLNGIDLVAIGAV